MEVEEALAMIYKGQSNVAVIGKKLQMPLETLKDKFREYVEMNPIDQDIWTKDVELSWPFIC